MSNHRTFVERVLAGEIYNLSQVDDDIAAWHASTSPDADCELYEWLGLTDREYDLFVEKPEALRIIINAKKYGHDVYSLAQNDNAHSLAARGGDPREADQLISWLKQTGRL